MKPYIYNIGSHTLHIRGFCRHTNERMADGNGYKCFSDEDEVLAFDGRAVSMCKLCQAERDKRMLKNK